MPYNKTWKDGKPIRNNEPPDPFKRNNNYVETCSWCEVCKLPHMPEHFLVARSMSKEEIHQGDDQKTMNIL